MGTARSAMATGHSEQLPSVFLSQLKQDTKSNIRRNKLLVQFQVVGLILDILSPRPHSVVGDYSRVVVQHAHVFDIWCRLRHVECAAAIVLLFVGRGSSKSSSSASFWKFSRGKFFASSQQHGLVSHCFVCFTQLLQFLCHIRHLSLHGGCLIGGLLDSAFTGGALRGKVKSDAGFTGTPASSDILV